MDLALVPPAQPDADAACLVASARGGLEQGDGVGAGLDRCAAPREPGNRERRFRQAGVLWYGGREAFRDGGDREPGAGLAERDQVAGPKHGRDGQTAAVQEGAVATGEIGEAPSPAAMPELGVHRGDDAGPGTLQHNLALGAAAQSRDVPADFYCLPRGEVDQLEVRHEAPLQASARIRPWRAWPCCGGRARRGGARGSAARPAGVRCPCGARRQTAARPGRSQDPRGDQALTAGPHSTGGRRAGVGRRGSGGRAGVRSRWGPRRAGWGP